MKHKDGLDIAALLLLLLVLLAAARQGGDAQAHSSHA